MDYAELQRAEGKDFRLSFLPYWGTEPQIGYVSAWAAKYGHGRWEEFFHTLQEARDRMQCLIHSGAIEEIELAQSTGVGMCTRLLDSWRDT